MLLYGQKPVIVCRKGCSSGVTGIGLLRKDFWRRSPVEIERIVILIDDGLKVFSIPHKKLLRMRNMMI